ncbi:hypothetical protein [Sphingorhabdus sp. EL138]|nr:hypothetical protein [Sphingorhabdus sp. EL138]
MILFGLGAGGLAAGRLMRRRKNKQPD